MSDVAPAPSSPVYPDVLGHPRPLWMLFMTEFWERFCYYGMRWALTLYIVAAFHGGDPSGEAPANATYGAYTALVYAFGVVGGYVADRILGFQRTVMLGGTFIAIGLFTMLVSDQDVFLMGLSFIIVGNGLFKPNISTMVGALYSPTDPRRDRGFTIFYMGINAGAFFAPLLTGWLANNLFGGTPEHPSYGVVFAMAGIGMVLGLIWFGLGRGMLLGNGAPPAGKEGLGPIGLVTIGGLVTVPVMFLLLSTSFLTYILVALFAGCMVMLIKAGRASDKVQMDRIWALLILFMANILFWMFFEQAGTSFNFLANNVVDRSMSFAPDGVFPTGWFQSVNPAAIVLLAPLVTMLWKRTNNRGIEPSIPRKFGLGLIGNALGFLVLMWALGSMTFESEAGKSMIPFWPLAACYVLQTLGELCLSPIGLSMVTKLAPVHMVGATMGAWFTSVALGNKLAGGLAEWISGEKGLSIASAQTGFTLSFWLLIGAGVLLLVLSPRINKLMHGIK